MNSQNEGREPSGLEGIRLLPGILAMVLIFHFLTAAEPDDSWMLYDDSQTAVINIQIDPETLIWIYENPQSDSLHPAQFHFQNAWINEDVQDVGFRLRGNTSRNALKKSFKISFNTFVPGREFYGVDKMNLNGEHNDPSIVRSKLCWDFFRHIGVTASRASHAAVYINGEYFGLYVSVEHIDDEFLRKNFQDDSGNLWKCLWPADLTYRGEAPENYHPWLDNDRPYELKTNEDVYDYSQLARLISVINNTPEDAIEDSLNRLLDVNDVLKYFAVNVLMGSWDDYWFLMNNYYLYHEPQTGIFHLIPYDYDNTFGIDWFDVEWSQSDPYTFAIMDNGERPLVNSIMSVPRYRNLYTRFLDYYRQELNDPAWTDRLTELRDMISPWAETDQYRRMDYGFDSDGGIMDFWESYTADHFDYLHVKRSILEYRQMRLNSLPGMLEYLPLPPVFYNHTVNVTDDSVHVTAAVFDEAGLTFVQVRLTPDGDSQQTWPLGFSPVPGSGKVEDADRWTGGFSIPPQTSGGVIRFYAMDVSGNIAEYPDEGIPVSFQTMDEEGVRLNEFMAVNDTTIADEEGEFDDWVELINDSGSAIDLSGWFLSDRPDNLTKWEFPGTQTVIPPGGFLLVWCDNDPEQGDLHTNFKLSGSGEFISLTMPDGITVTDSLTFGPQEADISTGRYPDASGEWIVLPSPTPGASNGECGPGDVNCDGAPDVLDIVMMVYWIMWGYDPSPAEIISGDMNHDGIIDVLDVVSLVNLIMTG